MNRLFTKFGAWAATLPILLLPAATYAQLSESQKNLATVQTGIGGTQQPLPVLIGKFINVILSVLGIFLVVYVVYAGYIYMTAGGDPAKVDKAKKMIGTSIVGIILVVAAYSISVFVIDNIVAATK